ncbi:retrovirus-related pol polyprotein from transposon TNT 1-94, partial [Tanacetum coccineum]
KRLSHLNFKNINKLAKQNKVLGLLSLVYPKDKSCSTSEKGKHHRASFKTTQNFLIKKCLHLLHIDLFGLVNPISINHEKYTLVIVDEYSSYTWVYFLRKKSQAVDMIMSFIRMVENQNDIKVKQIKTNNGTKFRNSKLKSFCDEIGISHNFSSPCTPEQNGVAERKNRTFILAARTMLNVSLLFKHFWTKAVRWIACYTQNRSIIVKRHDKTPYEYSEKGSLTSDTCMCLDVLIISKAFKVFDTRRQQIEETYHVIFYESMEVIRFTNTSVDEIRIDDSTRYLPVEFLHEDDPSRQYQADYDISYYITPHNHSLTELTKDTHVPEVVTLNEQNTPHTKDVEGPPDLINTEGTQEQDVQNEQINS